MTVLKRGKNLEEYIESNYPEEYGKYRVYRRKLEKKTPNIRRRYFDFLEDKADMPDFDCFVVD